MTEQASVEPGGEKKALWRRIVDFPLVAMIIALAVLLVPVGLLVPLLE